MIIIIIIITTTVEGYTVRARAQTVLSPVSAGHIRLTPCLYIYICMKYIAFSARVRETRMVCMDVSSYACIPRKTDRPRASPKRPYATRHVLAPPPRYFTVVPRRRSRHWQYFPSGLAFKRLFDGFPALQTIDTSPERGERTGFKIKSYTFGRDPRFVEVPVFRILLDDSKNGARGRRGDPLHRKLLLFPRQFTSKWTNSPTYYRH